MRPVPPALRSRQAPPARASRLARLALLALLAAPLAARAEPRPSALPAVRGQLSAVILDGQRAAVRWSDGDTFHIESGPLRGRSVRLADVNALEAYGPVHRIGALGPAALLELARSSTAIVAATTWQCTSLAQRDVYGRDLARCPEAAAALVKAGHAMVFAVTGRGDEALLALQREAQAARRGLWAGGVPPRLVSSLHSPGERGVEERGVYDRLVDTATGAARPVRHRRAYQVCQEVCLDDGPVASCMTYVPFLRRYRNRPACLLEPGAAPPGAAAARPASPPAGGPAGASR